MALDQTRVDLLLLDTETANANIAQVLRSTYSVATSSSVHVAREFLRRSRPAMIITELDLADGAGTDICRDAKALPDAPTVLVTTDSAERVPSMLQAGCDAVLLKPFAPNLLCSRVARLMRERAQRKVGVSPALSGTNQFWADVHCPYCDHQGVTSFDFTSHRRAWYACVTCSRVWLGRRRE